MIFPLGLVFFKVSARRFFLRKKHRFGTPWGRTDFWIKTSMRYWWEIVSSSLTYWVEASWNWTAEVIRKNIDTELTNDFWGHELWNIFWPKKQDWKKLLYNDFHVNWLFAQKMMFYLNLISVESCMNLQQKTRKKSYRTFPGKKIIMRRRAVTTRGFLHIQHFDLTY